MIRFKLLVEGYTELESVQQVLQPHFNLRELVFEPFPAVTGRNPLTGGSSKGGGRSFTVFARELRRAISAEGHKSDVWFGCMLDLYALPTDAPGTATARALSGADKARCLESEIAKEIGHARFIPYVQLHEFEALLFTDLKGLERELIDSSRAVRELQASVAGMEPESINETPDGAPSKRIIQFLPSYARQKRSVGPISALNIGLARLRDACPHFGRWIDRLELLIEEAR